MKKTVIVAIPTFYEDAEAARFAVQPYLDDMGVEVTIIEIRDEA